MGWFVYFETGSPIVQAGLELTIIAEDDLALQTLLLNLPSAAITGMYHTWWFCAGNQTKGYAR